VTASEQKDSLIEKGIATKADGGAGLAAVSLLFLRLGATAFGGVAVSIPMIRDEVVARRRWIEDSHFLDLLGATNLIPGPNATEMASHLGWIRAGWRGLVLAGVCFSAPATLITLGFAWTYMRYGSTPEVSWLLYGIKPIVISVMVHALWNLGRASIRGQLVPAVGIGVLTLYALGFNEIALLFGAALFVMLVRNLRRLVSLGGAPCWLLMTGAGWVKTGLLGISAAGVTAASFSLGQLFLTSLKIGSVLYGTGYVLLTFLRADFVERLHWLTEEQLLDAVAVGQATPGPLLSTATFIGFVLGSWQGALLATLGVFLPSFLFVAISSPIIPHIRRSPWTAALLDGVSIAALALMAGVTWQLGRAAVIDPMTAALAVLGAVLLLRLNVNSTWLVLLGAAAGLAYKAGTG